MLGLLAMGVSSLEAQGVCVVNAKNDIIWDGVVAPGARNSCMNDPMWGEVAPVALQPSGGSPSGHLYLASRMGRLDLGLVIEYDDNLTDWDSVAVIFDADHNGMWSDGDFYIKVGVTANTSTIVSNALCNQPCPPVAHYWKWNGPNQDDQWTEVKDAAAIGPTVLKTRHAYDYNLDDGDGDPKVWNMEISIPASATPEGFYPLQPEFGLGVFVYVDRNHVTGGAQQGTVLRWPVGLSDGILPADGWPGISDNILFPGHGFPTFPSVTTLGTASLKNVCFDVNFATMSHNWYINDAAATDGGPGYLKRSGNNKIQVKFRYSGPGMITTPVPNGGNVRLRLTPFNVGYFGDEFARDSTHTIPRESNTAVNTDVSTEFNWDFSDPSAGWQSFEALHGQVDELCADLYLENFDRNDDPNNDHEHINHNLFHASEYTSQVVLSADNLPGVKKGDTTSLALRVQPLNIGQTGSQGGSGGIASTGRSQTFGILFVLAGVFGLVVGVGGGQFRFRIRSTVVGIAVLMIGFGGCRIVQPSPSGLWEFTNASEIGLVPLTGDPGWYRLPIKGGETKRLTIHFTGQPLPYRPVQHKLIPRDSASREVRMPVKPGEVVTVLGFGGIDVDGKRGPLPTTSATGVIDANKENQRRYRLRAGPYAPAQYAGALIGSFDNWETSFLIGREASVIVPDNARMLAMAANTLVGADSIVDGGLDVYTIETPVHVVPTISSDLGDATYRIPRRFPTWKVLTSLNLYTYRIKNKVNPAGQITAQTYVPWGDTHLTMYQSHVQ